MTAAAAQLVPPLEVELKDPKDWDEGPNIGVTSASIAQMLEEGLTADDAFVGNQAAGLPAAQCEVYKIHLGGGFGRRCNNGPVSGGLRTIASEVSMIGLGRAPSLGLGSATGRFQRRPAGGRPDTSPRCPNDRPRAAATVETKLTPDRLPSLPIQSDAIVASISALNASKSYAMPLRTVLQCRTCAEVATASRTSASLAPCLRAFLSWK